VISFTYLACATDDTQPTNAARKRNHLLKFHGTLRPPGHEYIKDAKGRVLELEQDLANDDDDDDDDDDDADDDMTMTMMPNNDNADDNESQKCLLL
jgi:hypothetical protein